MEVEFEKAEGSFQLWVQPHVAEKVLKRSKPRYKNKVLKHNHQSKIEELLNRGVEKTTDAEHLKERLLSGKILRIKHGIDPTGRNIHIGRAAQFLKLKDFRQFLVNRVPGSYDKK